MKTVEQVWQSASINRDELFSFVGVTIGSKPVFISVSSKNEAIILAIAAMIRNRIDERLKNLGAYIEPDIMALSTFEALKITTENPKSATWIYTKSKELVDALDVEYPENSFSVHGSFRMFFNDSEYSFFCEVTPINKEIDNILKALESDFSFIGQLSKSEKTIKKESTKHKQEKTTETKKESKKMFIFYCCLSVLFFYIVTIILMVQWHILLVIMNYLHTRIKGFIMAALVVSV